jgi:hypothetical protein
MRLTVAQRQAVYTRSNGCCEYCRISQLDATSSFHIDHIRPVKHGGSNESDNLCLACYQCNRYKGSNYAAADPQTDLPTFLFHPRQQQWNEHFELQVNFSLSGLTPAGRATVVVLRMNDAPRLKYRRFAQLMGEYPCY